MTPLLPALAALLLAAPAAFGAVKKPAAKKAPAVNVFMGHYGTTVQYPVALRVSEASFGDEGDEFVFFARADAEGKPAGPAQYFLRICSKAARPGFSAKRLLRLIRADASRQGMKRREFKEGKAGKGLWLVEETTKPRVFIYVKETEEYVFQVSGEDKAMAKKVLGGIKQFPREEWDDMVVEMRRKDAGEDPFIPDIDPPASYSSKLGWSVTVPEGYTFHAEDSADSEVVYLFPLKHGVLVSREILTSASEYGHFGVAQIQAILGGKTRGGPKDQLDRVKGYYKENLGLADEDLPMKETADGWVLERLRPAYLRYIAWEKDDLLLQVVGADPKLVEKTLKSIR